MMNLILDYDGTVHDSMKTYAPAFRATVRWLYENGHIPKSVDYSDREISYWLGFNSTDMWNSFMPFLDPAVKETARKRLGDDMAKRIENGEGQLFDGAENMLLKLKNDGHRLIFLSNCRVHYMERHRRVFRLDRFFDRFFCCEEFGFIPKYEIFRRIAPEFDGGFIVIGDRFHDLETASENGLPSIGCGYGYGSPEELRRADIIVGCIGEIPAAVEKLSAIIK